jgi:hypothetical protein
MKSFSFLCSIALLAFALSSCTTKVNFLKSSVVPAAKGSVKVTKDGNNNYKIKVQISNLAESTQLSPPKSVYVVWLMSEDKAIKNIGQIVSGAGFMSKNLKAGFETISSIKPSKIFLTAENDPGLQYPFSEVVITTGDF